MLKKILLGLFIVLLCVFGYGIYYIEKEFAGIGLPWNDTVDLPTLPTFTNVKTLLSAKDEGAIFFPSHSPYDFSVLLTDFDNALPSTGKGTLFFSGQNNDHWTDTGHDHITWQRRDTTRA